MAMVNESIGTDNELEKARELEVGDVVQITNENHPWFPALLILDRVNPQILRGYYIVINNSDALNNLAYIRIEPDDVEFVGRSHFLEKKQF